MRRSLICFVAGGAAVAAALLTAFVPRAAAQSTGGRQVASVLKTQARTCAKNGGRQTGSFRSLASSAEFYFGHQQRSGAWRDDRTPAVGCKAGRRPHV